MSSQSCCICAQIAGDSTNDLLQSHLGGIYERRVSDVASGLHLMPSLGALSPGHVLLCPTQHVRSFVHLQRSSLRRVERLVADLSRHLSGVSRGAVQIFEHGDAPAADRVSCSVEHAHMHLIPGVSDLWPLARGLCSWRPVASLEEAAGTVGAHEYLLLRGLSSGWQIALAPAEGHPSQLLRQVVADAIGEPTIWNWRKYPRHTHTQASWDLVRALPAL